MRPMLDHTPDTEIRSLSAYSIYDLAIAAEDATGTYPPDPVVQGWQTVGDVLEWIEAHRRQAA